MTTETNLFITADEILGISVECFSCHVRSTVSFASGDSAQAIATRTACPHCDKRWFITGNDPVYTALVKFVSALADMRARSKEIENRAMPFGITLEITSDAFRASRDAD